MQSIDWLNSLDINHSEYGLERINSFLEKIGNPQDDLKYVHVAGTNGKGSVCAMISSILTLQGYKVGLYTSPHLKKLNERIKINGKDISDEKLESILKYLRESYTNQTFFEVLTAAAFMYFSSEKVDVVILETGLGGRLDATNVIVPVVSIITNITLEHTAMLGETVQKIAEEKAGIIKKNIPAITLATGDALTTIKENASKKNSKLIIPGQIPLSFALNLAGEFQKDNARIVFAAIQQLKKSGFIVSDKSIKEGFNSVIWPGRMQFIEKNVLVDCAHNPGAFLALKESILRIKKEKNLEKIIFVLGLLADKDRNSIIDTVSSFADYIIFTHPESPRAVEPEMLAKFSKIPSEIAYDPRHALKKAKKLSNPEDLIVVAGSFYLTGIFT